MEAIEVAILEVLSGQSEDYLCSPDAAAFRSIGLEDIEAIEAGLKQLEGNKFVEFYSVSEVTTLAKLDDDGTPIVEEDVVQTYEVENVVDTGWVITKAGRKAFKEL